MFDRPENRTVALLNGKGPMEDEDKLFALIENSIIARYSGDLERHKDPRCKRADTFTPLDTDAIRELLTTLWGEHITLQALELIFETLVTDGAETWPQAWCEEEEPFR